MDFSLRRINGENIHYTESGTDSEIQLIFTPGGFNPEIWKHQLRYFSKKYKTVAFRPTKSHRKFEGERRALEAVIQQESIENAVLISNFAGNPLVQDLKGMEEVKSTVLSGVSQDRGINRYLYNIFRFAARRNPKLLRKSLFSSQTEFRILKEFVEDVEEPDYETISSFLKKPVRQKEGLSLVVHAEDDRFSSLEAVRQIGSRISVVRRAGTFSFYEKPQDYNKALNDFLDAVENKVREEKIMKSAEQNRSLIEFNREQENRNKVNAKR